MLTTITGKIVANVHFISHWRASLCRCAEKNDEPKNTPRTDPSNESRRSSPTRNHKSANSAKKTLAVLQKSSKKQIKQWIIEEVFRRTQDHTKQTACNTWRKLLARARDYGHVDRWSAQNAAETLSYSALSGTQQKMELHRSTPRQNGQ